MSVETVVTDNGVETKNGKFSFDAGQDEIKTIVNSQFVLIF